MGSYSPQILPAPQGLFGGLNEGLSPILNSYTSAMMQKKFNDQSTADREKRKKVNYNSALADALRRKSPDQQIEENFTEDGPTFRTKTKSNKLSGQDWQEVIAGLGTEDATAQVAQRMGANKYDIASANPDAAMSLINGGVGNSAGDEITPTAMDTRKYVSGALKNSSFSKVSKAAKPAKTTFDDDIKDVVSGNSTWEDLVAKHPSKVNAIQKIKNGLDMASTESGQPSSPAASSPVNASGDVRSQAVAELTKAGYPLTPKNIDAAMRQLSSGK